MRIALISDIHDHVWNLDAVLHHVQDADALLCCGDLCSPFVLSSIASAFKRPVHVVLGNNDGDLYRIMQIAHRSPHVTVHGELFSQELGGKRIVANHFPNVVELFDTAHADVIVYGHDHRFAVERNAGTLTLNPGAVMGYNPIERRDVRPTYIVYDTGSHEAKGFALDGREAHPFSG